MPDSRKREREREKAKKMWLGEGTKYNIVGEGLDTETHRSIYGKGLNTEQSQKQAIVHALIYSGWT